MEFYTHSIFFNWLPVIFKSFRLHYFCLSPVILIDLIVILMDKRNNFFVCMLIIVMVISRDAVMIDYYIIQVIQ